MNKDWTGNKTTTFATLGASSHAEHDRQEHDYYATDPQAIEILLNHLKDTDLYPQQNIWENACGEGHLVKPLQSKGFNVVGTDLIDRGNSVLDFMSAEPQIIPRDIITNPPYKYAQQWVEKSMECLPDGGHLYLFLKLLFLESVGRKRLFKVYPPKKVLVFSRRIGCAINGDFESNNSKAVCYAWFIWEKGFTGKPEVEWL